MKQALLAIAAFAVLITLIIVGTKWYDGKTNEEAVREKDDYDYLGEEQITLTLSDRVYGYSHKIENYLVMGTDGSGNEDAEGEDYVGSMADFIAVVIIDHTDETFAILQLNRDTMTKVNLIAKDGSGEARALEQLCIAHWYGGNKEMSCQNTVDAVSELLGGLPFDGYYAIPMEQITRLNATVGGVTLTVQGDFSKEDPSLVEGETITLTDEQAECYVRGRMGVDDGTNISRMSRQKQFMVAYMKQAWEKTASDKQFLLDVFNEFSDVATTGLNGKTISKLGNDAYKYQNLGIFEFAGEEKLGVSLSDGLEHAEFYIDEASLVEVMTKLYHLEEIEENDKEEYAEDDEEYLDDEDDTDEDTEE